MNAAEIALVVAEAAPLLAGGRLERVGQPSPTSLCLSVRRPGATHCLFCSVGPDHGRLHLARSRAQGDAVRRFGQYLRKHVGGARVEALRQRPGDRIVDLWLHGSDTVERLAFELIGRHANVIAVNRDGRIADALRRVDGQRRRILPGETYAPPAGQAPAEGRGASAEALAAASPSDYFREVFEARERRSALGEGQKGLLQRLAHVRKRMQRIARAERDAAMTDSRAQALQRQAELLKANVHRVSTGDTSVTVEDYLEEGAPEVTIELDPRLPPVANMERLFRRAKKLARRVAEAERRGAEARERLARVEASAERIEEAKSPDEIEALAAEVAELAGERRTTASTQAAAGARQFVSADGWEVLVGRNAEDNDRLTLRWARSDDLWLHVRGVSGSHVVVPVPRGQSTPRDTLVDAATLAAFYSDARGRPRVEVDYTPVKYVRKPRKAPAGAVVLTRHKTLDLRVEPDRLARLLGR